MGGHYPLKQPKGKNQQRSQHPEGKEEKKVLRKGHSTLVVGERDRNNQCAVPYVPTPNRTQKQGKPFTATTGNVWSIADMAQSAQTNY